MRPPPPRLAALAAALALASLPARAAAPKPLTVDDVWSVRRVGTPVLSPDGRTVYGVLSAKGVPARLVYYPDENHWVLKGQSSKHWYGEVLAWLARWLK